MHSASSTSVALLIILATSCSFAEQPSAQPPSGESAVNATIDALEVSLELGRHRKFVDIRNNPHIALAPFTTDGCSGGLSIGWNYLAEKLDTFEEIHGDTPPWESCCVEHDRSYHSVSSAPLSAEESFALRKQADSLLRECVRTTGADRKEHLAKAYNRSGEEVEHMYSVIAGLMYRAVRVGGMPCTGLPWRWGYGWPECD